MSRMEMESVCWRGYTWVLTLSVNQWKSSEYKILATASLGDEIINEITWHFCTAMQCRFWPFVVMLLDTTAFITWHLQRFLQSVGCKSCLSSSPVKTEENVSFMRNAVHYTLCGFLKTDHDFISDGFVQAFWRDLQQFCYHPDLLSAHHCRHLLAVSLKCRRGGHCFFRITVRDSILHTADISKTV